MLRSDLCDYNDTYFFFFVAITVEGGDDNRKRDIELSFKNSAPFRSCISKISNALIDNAEDLNIVMQMYNFLEYSENYSMTSGSLWIYYRDEVNNDANENNAANNRINNNKAITSKFFEQNTKLIGSTPNKNNILDAEVVAPLKYLSNLW